MTNTRTIYLVDGTGFLASGLDDEARVAQRARQMLSKITEPCEENVVKHHDATEIFAEQNPDLTKIESDEHLIDRKLLDLMPAGGSYEVVELRTQFSPAGNRRINPTIGYSRIEYGACRMLNKGIPQDQLLAFLDEHEPDHELIAVPYGTYHKAVIQERDFNAYLAHARHHAETDPSDHNTRRLDSIQRRVDAYYERQANKGDTPQMGGPA